MPRRVPPVVYLTVCLLFLLPAAASAQKLVTGGGVGGPPTIRVFDSSGTDQSFSAYDPAFPGGVRVAMGDVNGDGVLDIITGAGPSGGPHVRIWDGVTLAEIGGFFAYDPAFPYGVYVAAGDVNGDGRADIITGAGGGPGGGPHVRVWDGVTFGEIGGFFAYDPAFPGGVNVAAGDVNGDGRADIITGAGPGGGPHVRVWDGATFGEIGGFFAYDPAYPYGVNVAAGDIDGDGRSEIVTGAGPGLGGGPHVRVWSGVDFHELGGFFAYDPGFPGGVTVGVVDLDRDGVNEIMTGPADGPPLVRLWTGTTFTLFGEYFAFDPAAGSSGVFIGSVSENPSTDPRFTSENDTTFTVGTPGTFTVQTTRGAVATLTVTGTLPTGVTFTDNGDRTGTLAGTPGPGTGGTYPLTFTADNGSGTAATQSFTLTVHQAPAITSANATSFSIGVPGTFTVTTTGLPAATLTATGALPTGVTFTDNADGTGTLSGTPAAGTGGGHPLTITATNSVGSSTQSFTLTVSGGPAITSANATTFALGAPGSFTVTAVGTPAPALSVSGTLPSGVTFVDNGSGSGTLSGTPAAGTAGTHSFTITAANGVLPNATQVFTLTITAGPVITSAASATFAIGAPSTFTVTTSGVPAPSLTLGGAALPAGVTFVDNGNGTGTLSGTPAAGTGGNYALTFTATNGSGSAVQNFTLTVNGSPGFTSANTTTFTVGTPGSFTVTTAGSPTPALAVSGSLPSGVTFTDNGDGTGTLGGTPAAGTGGSYALTFTATNGVLPNATQAFTLNVNQAPAITSAPSTTFTIGTAGSFTVSTSGFPLPSLAVGGAALPAGVTFVDNGNGTGTLSGTPAAGTGGSYAITFTATNTAGVSAPQAFMLTVNQAPAITSASSAAFVVGTAGSFTVTTTAFPTATITRTGAALPAGVTFVDNGDGTGTLSGTPAVGTAAAYSFTFTAANGVTPDATQSFTLNVNQAPAITSATSATFTVGTPGTFTVTTTGFPTPTVSQSGALPTGVTFTPVTRVLAGTPTQIGTFAIQFTAANGTLPDATQGFTLNVVCPVITVTPLVMPEGLYQIAYAGVDFNQTGSGASTLTWSQTGLPAGLAIDVTTGVVSGTPTTTVLNAPVVITVTDIFGCPGTLNTTITVRPTVDNESYNGGVGNTQFNVGAGPLTTPNVFVNDNVTIGDNGPGALSVTFNAPANGAVAEGTADGTFIYTPNVGFAGPTDVFTYTLTDGNGVTNTGTVTINLSNLVWYVNSAGGAGDGRSQNPFNTLNAAATPSASGSYIYVHTGSGPTLGNLAMDTTQALHGQGASFVLGGLAIAGGPASAPTLSGTVTLANATQVVGANFAPTGVPALVAANTTAGIAIDTVNVTGGTNALSLTNASGVVTVTNSIFTNSTGAEVLINQGNAGVTIGATINNNAGRSIDIQNRTGGIVTFAGPIADTGQGIFLNANTGSTINFTGGLSLSTTTNPAFTAVGGGTVSATQNNTSIVNTITTTTGTALNVANTTIGSPGLAFRSISANGATNGIVLNNTGATAGLTIAGNGGACTSAGTCSGGAIQNTTGDGLALTNTRNVSLTRLFVGGTGIHGINANAVNTLSLVSSRVQNAGNGDNEHGLNLVNATGTVTLDATVFDNAAEDLVHLENNNTNVTFNVTGASQFSYPAAVSPTANSAILLLPGGTASITASIQNATFTNIVSASAQIGANLLNSNGTQNFTFSSNTINVSLAARGSGLVVSGQEQTTTNLTISNNNFTGAGGNGVITIDTNDTSRVEGTVSGNTITNPPGIGMFIAVDEGATNDIVVNNNTITNAGGDSIQAVNFGGAGVSTMQLAITNNLLNGHSANSAVSFVGGISFSNFEDTGCLVLRGNTVTGTPSSPTQCGGAPCVDYYLEEIGGAMTFEEVPDTPSTTANAGHINSINDAGPVSVFGVIDLTNGVACNVALMATGGENFSSNAAPAIDEVDLAGLLRAAARRINVAVESADVVDGLAALGLHVTDLPDGQLGGVSGNRVSFDRHAAGWGWFVDPTPDQDEEFEPPSPETGERRAIPGGPADGRMDLLTALLHEIRHTQGAIDLDPVTHEGDLMSAKLAIGVRRWPTAVVSPSPRKPRSPRRASRRRRNG